MQEVKNARKKLEEKLGTVKPAASSGGDQTAKSVAPLKQNKFVRVAI